MTITPLFSGLHKVTLIGTQTRAKRTYAQTIAETLGGRGRATLRTEQSTHPIFVGVEPGDIYIATESAAADAIIAARLGSKPGYQFFPDYEWKDEPRNLVTHLPMPDGGISSFHSERGDFIGYDNKAARLAE